MYDRIKMSNIPDDIWLLILWELNNNVILKICKVLPRLKILENKYNIININKMERFPRISGHCAAYDVSNLDMKLKTFKTLNDQLKYTLDKLYELEYDLVRGDLICFKGLDHTTNDGTFIFDGCGLRVLDRRYDVDGSIPKEFTIINNNVPVNYWNHETKYNIPKLSAIIINRGIMGNIHWFDHSSVRDQCIDNIDYDYMCTYFAMNDKKYSIFCESNKYYDNPSDESNEDIKCYINKFISIFERENLLMLELQNDILVLNLKDYS